MVEFSDPQCICLFSILPEFPFLRPRLLPSSPLSLFPFLPSFFPRVARLVCLSARRSFAPTSTLSLSLPLYRAFSTAKKERKRRSSATRSYARGRAPVCKVKIFPFVFGASYLPYKLGWIVLSCTKRGHGEGYASILDT